MNTFHQAVMCRVGNIQDHIKTRKHLFYLQYFIAKYVFSHQYKSCVLVYTADIRDFFSIDFWGLCFYQGTVLGSVVKLSHCGGLEIWSPGTRIQMFLKMLNSSLRGIKS